MKKILSLILALVLLAGALPAPAEEEPMLIGMPNPMNEYAGIAEMKEDYPDIEMEEPPEGATDIRYSVADADDVPLFAEIMFTYNGKEYTYRCLPRDEDAIVFDRDSGYLAGLYYDFDVEEIVPVTAGDTPYNMGLHYYTPEGVGCVDWYDFEAHCEYSVGGTAEREELFAVAQAILEKNAQHTSVEGTLLAFDNDTLTLRLDNSNTLRFPCTLDIEAAPGDRVSVTYVGELTKSPTVIRLNVLYETMSFVGTVTAHDDSSVTVKAKNGSTIVFKLTEYTVIAGEDTVIRNNAQVTVAYTGDLTSAVYAFEVYIDVPGEEMDPKLIDKTLTGTVTKLTRSKLTIRTSKGKTYSFRRVSGTEYTGKYELKVNCTVTVRYDGYASATPDAKEIHVKNAAPKPTPTPKPTKKLKKAEGTVTAVCGIWITLDDGHVYTVNSANCTIKGSEMCEIGSHAVFRYYKSGSDRICESATFELRVY